MVPKLKFKPFIFGKEEKTNLTVFMTCFSQISYGIRYFMYYQYQCSSMLLTLSDYIILNTNIYKEINKIG